MSYTHRLATLEDATAITPLWQAFATERAAANPSMVVKPNFDFLKYVTHQLNKPLTFCWVLEHQTNNQKTIVGCLFLFFYNEAPPPNLPPELIEQHEIENPFLPRRICTALGLYIEPPHRQPAAIKQLIDAGIQQAEAMQVTDIDLMIAADQTGIQALLERAGFTKSAVQFTRHYSIPTNIELPSLHPPHPELAEIALPTPNAIPLRDPDTNELIRNPKGEPVFLKPLRDEKGELLLTSNGLPIYPTPVRDPQKDDWVFNSLGELVVCPVLRDDNGKIVEHQEIPQFHPPVYEYVEGEIRLKQDSSGNYVFCAVERDKEGKIVRNTDGIPIFKQLL